MDIVRNSQSYFGFKLPSELWSNRVKMFHVKYVTCLNQIFGSFDYSTDIVCYISLLQYNFYRASA